MKFYEIICSFLVGAMRASSSEICNTVAEETLPDIEAAYFDLMYVFEPPYSLW